LLQRPFPPNLQTVRICKACNHRFSDDEEYFAAFLGLLLSDGETESVRSLELAISSNHLIQDNLTDNISVDNDSKVPRLWIEPDNEKLQAVILKNALSHALLGGSIAFCAENAAVNMCAFDVIPENHREQLFGISNDWITVQTGIYRYRLLTSGNVMVRSVLYEYLACEVIFSRT